MSYRLVITEKPSVAQAYAKVLGATNRSDGYLEGSGYLVSWCVGHLVELAPPNVYDEKYVKWSVADLPILPEKWQYLVSASTKKQFGILKKLMHRKDVESLICATELTLIQQILLYIVGLMLAPLGTAVYFTTNISKSAYDEIITALHNALRWPVWVSKNATEATMLILSLLVRGPVGVTTVVTAFAFGPVLQKYMELLDKKKFKILQWEKF